MSATRLQLQYHFCRPPSAPCSAFADPPGFVVLTGLIMTVTYFLQEQSAWSEIVEACQELRSSVRLSEDKSVSTSSTQLLHAIRDLRLPSGPQATDAQQSKLALNALALAREAVQNFCS